MRPSKRLLLFALGGAVACSADPSAGSRADGDAGTDAGVEAGAGARQCNGRVDLCDRPYDSVVFPAAHNAHAALEYGYAGIGNQLSGFERQLADGVRVFLFDVYGSDTGESIFCHGVCGIANTPHSDGLAIIGSFLEQHPSEVVTFIYEDHVDSTALAADIEAAGLEPLAFRKDPGAPWPTLAEMIDSGRRLVITAENGGPPPEWLFHVWDVAFDTPYTFTSVDAFSCELNRGSRANDLFLLNHWVSQPSSLPSETDAPTANAFDVLYARATECAAEAGHVPNFVAVDFYEHGDLFAVVDALNEGVTAELNR